MLSVIHRPNRRLKSAHRSSGNKCLSVLLIVAQAFHQQRRNIFLKNFTVLDRKWKGVKTVKLKSQRRQVPVWVWLYVKGSLPRMAGVSGCKIATMVAPNFSSPCH